MEEWNNAQHIYCSPHPVQFLWDTDSLVHTLVHKELDLGSGMLQDMLFHILYTLDLQWDSLFLLYIIVIWKTMIYFIVSYYLMEELVLL